MTRDQVLDIERRLRHAGDVLTGIANDIGDDDDVDLARHVRWLRNRVITCADATRLLTS